MSNYNNLKTSIDANIKQNGNQEITGPILNSVLNQMVNILGTGYQFAGVATLDPATDPGTPDAKVFYIANGKGTYTNFGGIKVMEDDVVVLYWDSAWHKVATGIASQEKLSELDSQIEAEATSRTEADAELQTQINGKQEALTLTVKDNGNIVLANIQGQSKEFMPATPSGDPMHYAYEAAGAEWNGTGENIVKTAPWADLADDDADKTVVHKAGYWYLNGLGDITNEQMRVIYNRTNSFASSNILNEVLFDDLSVRTNINQYLRKGSYSVVELTAAFVNSRIEVVLLSNIPGNGISANSISFMARSNKIKHFIGVLFTKLITKYASPFLKCPNLKTISISSLKFNVSFVDSPLLTSKSILYMIQKEEATSPIIITLHADAYARAMANADIVSALEAHPNVSLASA